MSKSDDLKHFPNNLLVKIKRASAGEKPMSLCIRKFCLNFSQLPSSVLDNVFNNSTESHISRRLINISYSTFLRKCSQLSFQLAYF